MRKKDYEKPTMQVVMLQHWCDILAGSSVQVGVQDYDWIEEEEEGSQTGLHNYNWNNLDEE